MTGYSASKLLGRNCRLLQGPDTDANAVAALANGLRTGGDVVVRLTNYKANGSTFEQIVALRPVCDTAKACRFFAGFHLEVQRPFI